jgi:hypothetical protein
MESRYWGVALLLSAQLSARGSSAQGTTPGKDAVPAFTLTRELRFGGDDAGPAELTGFVRMVPAANGDVYAYSGCDIKRYDRNAKFVERIGRCGDGPNEYRNVRAMGLLGDTVWIADENHRRVTLVPANRKNPVTLRLSYAPKHEVLNTAAPSAMLRGGLALAHPTVSWSTSDASYERMVMSPLVRVKRDGDVLDTVASLLVRHAPDMRLTYRGEWLGAYRQPLNLHSIWAARADGEGLVLIEVPTTIRGTSAILRVRRFNARATQVSAVDMTYAPLAVSSKMRDSIVEDMAKAATRNRDAALSRAMQDEVRPQIRQKLEWPSHVPPVSQVYYGIDGSLWISGPEAGGKGFEWAVYDASGRLVGRMAHPGRRFIAYADLTHVYVVEPDDDGIPWIVRYRVNR